MRQVVSRIDQKQQQTVRIIDHAVTNTPVAVDLLRKLFGPKLRTSMAPRALAIYVTVLTALDVVRSFIQSSTSFFETNLWEFRNTRVTTLLDLRDYFVSLDTLGQNIIHIPE